MRFESVTAHAFGPFRERSLQLGQGMTVIHGPNESGKSTWHAALYVGLCGIRRASGLRADDREFRNRHRPWDGEGWEVSTVVQLADGRRVELRHDLNGKVACQARDADLGRDYSEEVIFEGTPDGSRWLGLDRRSFLSTACVRQADIQLGSDQAGALQEHLQRAAATAGTDATAAAAIARIDSFRRDFVGSDRRNSTKPLRVAREQVDRAQSQLEAAQADHREYLRLQEETEQLQGSLDNVRYSLRLTQAAQARRLSDAIRRQANRARELAGKIPIEPQDPSELRQQVHAVGRALGIWENRPAAITLSPPTSEEITREIQELPPMPNGDTKPHPDVVEAQGVFRNAHSNLEAHQSRMPSQPETVAAGGLIPEEIRSLSADLALEEPAVDPGLDERFQRACAKAEALQQPEVQSPDTIPSSAFLRPLVILLRVLANLLRSLFGTRKPGVDFAAVASASEELRQAETALGEVRFQLSEVRQRKEKAKNTANEKGLPADPDSLIDLARRAEEGSEARNEMSRWRDEDRRLRDLCTSAMETLKRSLESRGASTDQGLPEAAESYIRECVQRDSQAQQATRRAHLEQLLEDKKKQEAVVADSDRQRTEAAKTVAEAAHPAGVSADTEEALVESLRLWLGDSEALIREREEAKDEWRELQELLNGRGVADLDEAATRRTQEAEQLATGIEEASIASVDLGEDPESLLGQCRQAVGRAETDLAEKRGQFEQFASNIPSVAEAEEELTKAEAELSRVRTLDQTLAKTRDLLSAAQDRVHRSLAPLLRDALKPWLHAVTQGRYQDVRVDVETLAVTVSGDGGGWREGSLLSHGTAEQIYLLLRVVMSRHLTKNGETCPLILDDVTVHCDPDRQREILSLLHEVSGKQQVILFSQEPETLAWAEEHLSDVRDQLIELDPHVISP